MVAHPWIIPLIPAASFLTILFFGTRMPRRGAELGVAAMASGLVLSTWLAIEWITGSRVTHETRHPWFDVGSIHVAAGTLTDGLTAVMLVLVSIISLLVQIYSSSYMRDDRRYTHYFAVLTLFTAAMQWFVMSANVLQMIFGWEVMSLCSFLLIGHWWEEKRNVHAAMKAFLTTRASDIGLFVGVIVLFFAAGDTFRIIAINDAALAGGIEHGLLIAAASALLLAVIGKSAQFPLHTWLPDAMAGPTPMSALIHAATMVVAGVFLIARLFPVFAEAFSIGSLADTFHGLNPVALIGAITIIVASLLAFVQTDIKKLLSYSTVSQLGFMVMALGVGAWVAAIFHLFTHAFAKALLFLNAGNVSHAVYGFDLERDMGGLRKPMPITHATFVVGGASLVGIGPLAGFWSKEQIVAQAGANGYTAFAVVALVGTFLTAAYMFRCYALMFLGEHRGSAHPHEAPRTLTVPCVILAIMTAGAGFLHAPALGIDAFGSWVKPDYLQEAATDVRAALPLVIELLLVALGLGIGVVAHSRGVGPRGLATRFTSARAVYHLLHNRLYLDWLYDKIFVHGIRRGLAWLVHWVDHNVIDNFVDRLGRATVAVGVALDRHFDGRLVDGTVSELARGTNGAGRALSSVQNGRVQRYLTIAVAGVAIVTAVIAAGGLH